MQWSSSLKHPQETQASTKFPHGNTWGFSQSHCWKEAVCGWESREEGPTYLGGADWLWAALCQGHRECGIECRRGADSHLFSFCFRIKWPWCALTRQSEPSCCGTSFRSTATPQCPLHGLTAFNTGPIPCSLLSHDGQAGLLSSWHAATPRTCEFRLARPRINASSSHQPCSHG